MYSSNYSVNNTEYECVNEYANNYKFQNLIDLKTKF